MSDRPPYRLSHPYDLNLATAVVSGSRESWHAFIDRYGGLVEATIRAKLYDTDDVRTVFTEVLTWLYEGGLRSFDGRASLSTWLTIVVRGRTVDYLRKRLGRSELPVGMRGLSETDQAVFRAYYVEGLGFDAVRERMGGGGDPVEVEAVVDALDRIEGAMGRRSRRRLGYELRSASMGTESGRLLEFFDLWRQDAEASELSPDQELLDREVRETVGRVRDLVARLPEKERRAILLRFDHELTAREIARELGLTGQRKAYTILDRALRRLRRWLTVEET